MQEALKDGRVWAGFALVGALLLMQVVPRHAPTDGPSIVMRSALLDWDLPGTLPEPTTARAAAQIQQTANGQGVTCGVVETYRITDAKALNTALEEAQAERHYLRYRSKQVPGQSRWEGPKRLLMLESKGELLICELAWPMSGQDD